MNRFYLMLVLPTLTLIYSPPLLAAGSLGKTQFVKELNQVAQAEIARNPTLWAHLIVSTSTPDCKFSDSMGNKFSLKDSIDGEKMMMATTTKVYKDFYTVPSFTQKGNTATAVVNELMIYGATDPKGYMGKKGASHKIQMTSVMTFQLIQSKQGWLTTSIYGANPKMIVDGKVLSPGAAAQAGD